jgi:hypothetical protein
MTIIYGCNLQIFHFFFSAAFGTLLFTLLVLVVEVEEDGDGDGDGVVDGDSS